MSGQNTALLARIGFVLALCLLLAISSSAFLTTNNLLNVLRQASLVFLIASGLTLVILTAGIDLSVGANVGLSACLCAVVLKASGSILLAVVAGLACGAVIGLANSLFIVLLAIPPFIATYGMLWIVNGITYKLMSGTTIEGFPPGFRFIGSGYWLGIPVPIYLMLGFFAAGALFARHTRHGRELFAIGANPVAARLSGIPVRARLILVYTVCGAMAGLSGLVYLARLNSAEADIGDPMLLPAVAAVLVGGTSLFGGLGGLSGTLIGSVIVTLVLNGMNLMSVSTNWQPMITSIILLGAVLTDTLVRRHAEGAAK